MMLVLPTDIPEEPRKEGFGEMTIALRIDVMRRNKKQSQSSIPSLE